MKAIGALAIAVTVGGCGIQPLTGVYEYAVTDPYDIQQVNKLPNTGTTHLVGSHFEGRYTLRAGESRKDVIRVESYNSGATYNTNQRRAQISVAATDTVTKKTFSAYIWLWHPGSTLINIGPYGVGAYAVSPENVILGILGENGKITPVPGLTGTIVAPDGTTGGIQ